MKVILIPCSGQKIGGGTTDYKRPRLWEILGDSQFVRLLAARAELGKLCGLGPGPDLGAPDDRGAVEFRQAFERYDGIMYRRAEFRRLFSNFQGRVLIISALYGLLDAGDPIRSYDLTMDDRLPSGEKVWRWWMKRGLPELIAVSLGNLRAAEVHDLLIESYRKAAVSPAIVDRFHVKAYNYPGMGFGALYRRGDDLRELLSRDE
jgi:hypothetical protein